MSGSDCPDLDVSVCCARHPERHLHTRQTLVQETLASSRHVLCGLHLIGTLVPSNPNVACFSLVMVFGWVMKVVRLLGNCICRILTVSKCRLASPCCISKYKEKVTVYKLEAGKECPWRSSVCLQSDRSSAWYEGRLPSGYRFRITDGLGERSSLMVSVVSGFQGEERIFASFMFVMRVGWA